MASLFAQSATENCLNSDGHDEVVIEIFTFFHVEVVKALACINRRFNRIAKDDTWKPNLLLYTWGSKQNSGQGEKKKIPSLLSLFYTPQKRRQVKQVICSSYASFAVTHGGKLFWRGQMDFGTGEVPNAMTCEHPTIMKSFKDHNVSHAEVTCPGYFHQRNEAIAVACLCDEKLFQWGQNMQGHCFVNATHQTPQVMPTNEELLQSFVADVMPQMDTAEIEESALQNAFQDYCRRRIAEEQRRSFIVEPRECTINGKVYLFSCGVAITCVATIDVDGMFHVYQAYKHKVLEVIELAGIELKQLVCGGWFCLALTTSGEVYSWGETRGKDTSNGCLLGRSVDGNDSFYYSAERVAFPGDVCANGPISYISASTYSALAITATGLICTWGDSDGGALGHTKKTCNKPALIETTVKAKQGSMSYTSGSLASVEGDLYLWGGRQWDEEDDVVCGIQVVKNAVEVGKDNFTKVDWNEVAPGYINQTLKVGHAHGIIVARKSKRGMPN